MEEFRSTLLLVLDGWGYATASKYNAIQAANTPCWKTLWQTCPHTLISASGTSIGLPDQQMGNSEVGHLTIGAGRLVQQELTRIDAAIANGDFFQNTVFLNALHQARTTNKTVHVLGLLSAGGVHSHEKHIQALVQLASQENVKKLYIHVFLDGRDTPPQSAMQSIAALEAVLQHYGVGKIVSLIGRYYAMDRDQRWDRTQKAYALLAEGKSNFSAKTPEEGLAQAYKRGETDEFVQPTVIQAHSGLNSCIENGDIVLLMNFRADRMRQLTRAFVESTFKAFDRSIFPKPATVVSLTPYAADIETSAAFLSPIFPNSLGEVIAAQQLKQLRLAETEKYPHVTFFFNGGRETVFFGEDRILVPSLKVATYDLAPEMRAKEITEHLIEAMHQQQYAFIVCNIANADMVGHSGNFSATVKAVEIIDACLMRITNTARQLSVQVIITADHGNAECMFDYRANQAHTAHTNNVVPFIYLGHSPAVITKISGGTLADIAPTILYTMGLKKPNEMTGQRLIAFE